VAAAERLKKSTYEQCREREELPMTEGIPRHRRRHGVAAQHMACMGGNRFLAEWEMGSDR
jgi:hypothetical protein